MWGEAFRTRIAAERRVLRAVNQCADVIVRPLPGLGKAAVASWMADGLAEGFPVDRAQRLGEILVTCSTRLRLESTASHRAEVSAPATEFGDVESEVAIIESLMQCEVSHRLPRS